MTGPGHGQGRRESLQDWEEITEGGALTPEGRGEGGRAEGCRQSREK